MILTGIEIKDLIVRGRLEIKPFMLDTIRENGVDLRLHDEYAVYAYNGVVIRPCEIEDARPFFNVIKSDEIVIPPKTFVLLSTEEYIKMPDDLVGLANLRSTLARYGLVIPPTVVDAGFEGNITIEAVNVSPNTIVLKKGIRFLHLVFVKTSERAVYAGVYQGQKGVTPPKGLKVECK